MLSSSDAKWRCMWHMFVWSILMTLVSQFLGIRDHVAFYIFASGSVLVLPALTAVYSNTSGRHGSELLRVGYIAFDPVLVCITITPVQLLKKLPTIIDEYFCLTDYQRWNETKVCLTNLSEKEEAVTSWTEVTSNQWPELVMEKRMSVLVIQGCLVVPILLSLLMGRRTMKMYLNTYIFSFLYWLVLAIEAADLLESAMLNQVHQHVVFTTEAIVSIIMILCSSYAIVTLCSFITPAGEDGNGKRNAQFNFLYRSFVGVTGIFLGELPFLIARIQIIAKDSHRVIQGSFYMWVVKDLLMMGLIVIVLFGQKITSKYDKIFNSSCTPLFDNPNVFFQPEVRDRHLDKPHKPVHLHNLAMKDAIKLINLPRNTSSAEKEGPLKGLPVSASDPEDTKKRSLVQAGKMGKTGKPAKKVTFSSDRRRKRSGDSEV